MVFRVLISSVLTLLFALKAVPIWACSLNSDFFGMSNFELVAEADAIVIATAESVNESERGPGIVFRATDILKGENIETVKNRYGYAVVDLPKTPANTLNELHPSAMAGSCSRSAYEIGGPYIVMVTQDEKGVRAMDYPFERNASDYHGPDSLWRRTIGYYIDVQTNPDRMEQIERLRADREMLAESEDPMDQLLAADIADHLTSISPLMPTDHLIALYEAVQKQGVNTPALQAPTGNPEYEVHPELVLIDELFGQADKAGWDREAASQRVLLALSKGDHSNALPFMKAQADAPGAPSLLNAYVIEMLASAEDWDAMIARVDPFVFEALSTGSTQAASETMMRVRGAMKPWSDNPIWTETAILRSWYPEFAVRYARANTRLGNETGLPKGIDDIVRPKNYRADPELTLIFASDHDKPVRDWARKEISQLFESDERAFSDAFILPLHVLLSDYKFDESDSFTEIFCHSEKGRPALIRATALMNDEYFREDMLERLAVSDMDDEDRKYLILSMMTDAGEKWSRYASGKGWMDDDLIPMITSLLNGETPNIDAEPILCESTKP